MATTTVQAKLWRHSNFLRLWISETISQFGTQFTGLALPFTAVLLGANAAQFGILAATGTLPFLLFGLVIGVWVDRHRRRRIMMTANIGRGFLLGLIPIAAFTGMLSRLGMPLLYTVSFLVGVLTVLFDVSYQAILPSLVLREQLVEGNSKLEASRSTAQVVGPSVAGIVIQIVTAPLAIAFDALSYFGSAFFLNRIKQEDEVKSGLQGTIWQDIREGLEVVLKDTRLRSIAGCTGTSNFFSSAIFAIIILYFVDQLHLNAFTVGLIFSVGSVGALVGVASSSKLAKRFGVGPAIVGSMLVSGLAQTPNYIANPTLSFPVLKLAPFTLVSLKIGGFTLSMNSLILMIGNFALSITVVVYNINQVSLRQAIVPIRLQGRMNATMRFLVWGTIPIGALTGGILGTILGLRTAIGIGVAGSTLAFLWVLLSPVRSLKAVPEPLA